MKTKTTVIMLALVILCNGCCCLPFLYPKTGVHGRVVDQYDNPVSNVAMQARWVPAWEWFVMMPHQCRGNFLADSRGRWSFYKWDVEDLYIEAMPPAGYNYALRDDRVRATYIGPFRSGECPTNDFILRMIKIAPQPQPKETK